MKIISSNNSPSQAKRMIAFVILAAFLTLPALPMVSAQTYEIVDLGYETVYSSATKDISQITCWGDQVAYYQFIYNPDTALNENATIKIWNSGSSTSSVPVSIMNTLSISQGYVVFANRDPSTNDVDIYYSTGSSPSKLLDTTANSWYPRIDGSNVVFATDNSPLRVKSIGGSLDVELPADSTYSTYFDISGDRVVYDGADGVHLFNTSTLADDRILADGRSMKISGDKVAYSVLSNFGKTANLYIYDISTKASTHIYSSDYGLGALDIDGNFVVFDSYIYDIQAQTLKQVAGGGSDYVSAGGGSFAWYYEADTTIEYGIRHAAFPTPGPAPAPVNPTPPPSDATHVIIGPGGGAIYVDDFHLQVYQNSLGENIEFYVIKPVVNNNKILKPFELKPDGITFNPPAQISINTTGTRAAGNELMHLVNGEWVPVESTPSSNGLSLVANITSTGTYALSEARQIASQALDTVGGVVSIPDVNLNIPANALAGTATVAVQEVFVEASNIAHAVSVDLGNAVLSVPAQLSFNVPAGMDSASAQVGQLVGDAWIEVTSTVNSAGQLVADITEGGIYGLINTATGSGGIPGIPFPSGMTVLAVMLSSGLAVAVVRRRHYEK